MIAETGQFRATMGRVRGSVTAVKTGPPKAPQESRMQRWFREAETDDSRAELFVHLGRADNWYDLYKSAELARRVAGDKALKNALGADGWKEWKRIWQTANCYRHAPDPKNYPLPAQPAKFRRRNKLHANGDTTCPLTDMSGFTLAKNHRKRRADIRRMPV
jgi:hypothetical protein